MFEVSEEALEKINLFLKEREGAQSIRILMTEGGWKGPYLVMAIDEQKKDDEVFVMDGITFLIEKDLFQRTKPIHIGFTHSTLGFGYTIDSELKKLAEDVSPGCHEIYSSCQDLNHQQ
jgi:Fe-S cluster assembly iron-binding protein IscA